MPHIKLEYTDDVAFSNIDRIFEKIKDVLICKTSIRAENCKFKAISLSYFSSMSSNFVHLEISILEGRSPKIIKLIGNDSLQIIKDNVISEKKDIIQFSVEIREINKLNYFTTNKI